MAATAPSKSHPKKSVFTGTFIYTPALDKLSVLHDAVVGVEHGVIKFIEHGKGRSHGGM